jgi:hypothetical protein
MGKRAALSDVAGGSDLDIRLATEAIEENQPSAFRSAKKEPTCCGSERNECASPTRPVPGSAPTSGNDFAPLQRTAR